MITFLSLIAAHAVTANLALIALFAYRFHVEKFIRKSENLKMRIQYSVMFEITEILIISIIKVVKKLENNFYNLYCAINMSFN